MNQSWFRRRWLDFRLGHSIYLIFALSFSNFVLIFYRLLVEQVEFLDEIFTDLWIFAIFFVLLYIPVSIVIGVWHRKTQLKVEQEQMFLQNPFLAKNFRVMIDVIEGKASKEEIEKFQALLRSIENRSDSSFLKD